MKNRHRSKQNELSRGWHAGARLTSRCRACSTRRPRDFPEGALLTLRFDLMRTSVIVQVVGEVRYCLPGVGVGVQFVDLAPSSRAAIEKELEELQK
jgi:PilZ domain